jgi:hypothetical protein
MNMVRFDLEHLTKSIEETVSRMFGTDGLVTPVTLIDQTKEFENVNTYYGLRSNPKFIEDNDDIYKRFYVHYVSYAPLSDVTRAAVTGEYHLKGAWSKVKGIFSETSEVPDYTPNVRLFSQIDNFGMDDIITEPQGILFEDYSSGAVRGMIQRSNRDYVTLLCGEIYRRSTLIRKYVHIPRSRLLNLYDGVIASASLTFMHARSLLERSKDRPALYKAIVEFMTRTQSVHMRVWESHLNRIPKETLRLYLDAQYILFSASVEDATPVNNRTALGLRLTANGYYALQDVMSAINLVLRK